MKLSDSTVRKGTFCLRCGGFMDRAANLSADGKPTPPKDGDISLCIKCGHVAVFEGDGLREPTPEEKEEIDNDPTVNKCRCLILLAQIKRFIEDGKS